jgi:hypothetical protein
MFLLRMVKAALCEIFSGIELETITAARSGRKDFEGEVRELRIKIERQ